MGSEIKRCGTLDEPKHEKLPFLKRAQLTSLTEAGKRNEEAAELPGLGILPLPLHLLLTPPPPAPSSASGSDELEQQVLEGVQALLGVSGGSFRAQLGGQEEELPVVGDGAQGQGFVQLRHAHGVGLVLRGVHIC